MPLPPLSRSRAQYRRSCICAPAKGITGTTSVAHGSSRSSEMVGLASRGWRQRLIKRTANGEADDVLRLNLNRNCYYIML